MSKYFLLSFLIRFLWYMKQKIFFLTTLFLAAISLNAQNTGSPKLKLFIDCGQAECDMNYIRQEMPLNDFVYDRQESDFHILITAQGCANGGEKYNVLLYGQNKWINNRDSIYFFTEPNGSQDNRRKQLVKALQASIIPFLVKTGNIDKVSFVFAVDTFTTKSKTLGSDKWNNWTFNIGGRARFSGDKNYKTKNLAVNGSASRVTGKSKIQFSFFTSTDNNVYKIEDNADISSLKTINNYLEVEQDFVKSLSPRWSWALEGSYRRSSYDNLRDGITISGGAEYNIFPYKLSSSKFFIFRYMLDVTNRNYLQETIYGKCKETLFSTNMSTYIYLTQPWGNMSSGVSWYNYLHDFSKNNFSIDANLELRLFKGVSIYFYGNGSLINDQLSLAKQGASSQEVLLRLRALATNFNYYTSVGINYRFGSSFSNFVNPRFTNGRN